MSSKKKKRKQSRDEDIEERIHKEKCCTTKLYCIAIVFIFIGLILLVAAVGLYNANDLDQFATSQGPNDCYVVALQARGSQCNTESCANCWQPTYFLSTTDQPTCGAGGADGRSGSDACETWENGCISIAVSGPCEDLDADNDVYATGDTVTCYSYNDMGTTCRDAGKIDPDDEWQGEYVTYQVLLAFAIILIIVAIVLFIWAALRCLCKKVENENDVVEESGTGCYWCLDYDRCCYGTGTGHATIVNPVEQQPTRKYKKKDKSDGRSNTKQKKSKKKKDSSSDDDDYDEEQQELR